MARTPQTVGASTVNTDPLNQPFVEMGASGLRQYGGVVREEWLRDLQGWRGIRVFKEMRDNDPIIGGIFLAIELVLRNISFRIEPADKNVRDDVEAAAFVNSCMTDMDQAWPDLIGEVLTFLQYGFAIHETVYKVRGGRSRDPKRNSIYDDGLIGWRKFAGRAQDTLLRWEFDESGDAIAMVQMIPTGSPLLTVPLARCLHFRTSSAKGDPTGRSLMRNSYSSWYYKKQIQQIEATGLERDLAGVPTAWVPVKYLSATASAEDRATLNMFKKMVRDTVRNEQEGFVLPLAYDANGNKMFDFTLMNSGGKRAFDTSAIINRYDQRIAISMVSDFILLGHEKVGSFALSDNKVDLFEVAINAWLDVIASEFNRKAIPDLLELNGMTGSVRMQHADVAKSDLAQLGEFVERTTRAGALTVDDTLEAHLRDEAGLPPSDMVGERTINEGGDASETGADDTAATDSTDPARAQGDQENAPEAA